MDASITLSTEKPSLPSSDFAFLIDFKKGEGSPGRVFQATHAFIEACEAFDKALVASIDSRIQPVMVLEDIEAASLKTYFKNLLEATDNEALKHITWKPLVGQYLVKAKYAVLRWLNNEEGPKNILVLLKHINELAENTEVLQIPYYTEVKAAALKKVLEDYEGIKEHLIEGDKAVMIVSDSEQAHFNLSSRLNIDAIEQLATRETEKHIVPRMVLVVKKPDYLGDSMWDFRHGEALVKATIEDAEWIQGFRERRVTIMPGDALRCQVRIETRYGYDNEVIAVKHYVEKVLDVITAQYYENPDLFPNLRVGDQD